MYVSTELRNFESLRMSVLFPENDITRWVVYLFPDSGGGACFFSVLTFFFWIKVDEML